MRNLTSTFSYLTTLPSSSSGKRITGSCVNPEDGKVWVVTESLNGDGECSVEVSERVEKGIQYELRPIAQLSVFLEPDQPESSKTPKEQLISLHYLPDEQTLCSILRTGEIALIRLNELTPSDEIPEMDVVGSIDPGVKSAAWAPDDEQVVLVTGEDKVMLMTRDFEVLHEAPLRSQDFGEDEQINVGWGSKKTQFHGSLGKTAASASSLPQTLPSAHPTDDALPRITWRGDGQFFAISSLDGYTTSTTSRRQIRVYTRTPCTLSTTSEPIFGLGGATAWRPSGNLITAVQRFGYEGGGDAEEGSRRCEVVMLERNGLQHGGFGLREDEVAVGGREGGEWEVKELRWSSGSEVLAVWVRRGAGDVVQLWTMNNYHYYLKQELHPPASSPSRRFTAVDWHPEEALTLYLTGENFVQERRFDWETCAGLLGSPKDTGTVVVIDGARLLITPFRTANIPPPMSAYQILLPSPPIHLAHSPTTDSLTVLLRGGKYQTWDLHTRLKKLKGPKGLGTTAKPVLRKEGVVEGWEDGMEGRQVGCDGEGRVWVLVGSGGRDLVLPKLEGGEGRLGRLLVGGSGVMGVQDVDGAVVSADGTKESLGTFCFNNLPSLTHGLLFALSRSLKLYALTTSSSPTLIASDVTSFTLSSTFLIYTTSTHTSMYAPLSTVQRILAGESVTEKEKVWESRRVERGSRIVTVVEDAMGLVLQMPRGNLETVNPRPLVLEVVQRNIMSGDYRSAFLTCRRHRIDLNVLYDFDPAAFKQRLGSFLDQVHEVEYLNLFVSGLSNEDLAVSLYNRPSASSSSTSNKINSICDSIRTQLESRDLIKYVDTILTTHVCKSPPDYESGLRVLLTLKEAHPGVVEDAIKYIIFLTDVNRLYDVALGMYDFQLVLMVAQYSQKDPKEYLPFLRELKSFPKYYQRFKIDDHLGRHASALENLNLAGPDKFEEAAEYVEKHNLFTQALKIYKNDSEHLKVIHDLYAESLFQSRSYYSSAISFILAENPHRALAAYERAHSWRELFSLALSLSLPAEEIGEIADRVAEYLATRNRHLEAARIYLDYSAEGRGVEEAVHVLCGGLEFGEAYRLTTLHSRPELVERTIHPGLEDAQEGLLDVLEEMVVQVGKERMRGEELVGEEGRMISDPEAFFMIDNEPAMENMDIQSTATGTTMNSTFTRYTSYAPSAGPTVWSAKTGQTTKTHLTGQTGAGTETLNGWKKRRERKKQGGRRGTREEWEYLGASLGRLGGRIGERGEQPAHKELATELQEKYLALRDLWRETMDWAHARQLVVEELRKEAEGEGEGDGEVVRAYREKMGMAASGGVGDVAGITVEGGGFDRVQLAEWTGLEVL